MAPNAALTDHQGHPATLVVRGGSTVVVDFFATWCGPCHAALAALNDIARERATQVRLVVIAVGEEPAIVDAFFASHPLPANAIVLFDRDGSAARAWGQHRFPTTFLVGSDNVIRFINRGYGEGYPARVRRWLDRMLVPNAP